MARREVWVEAVLVGSLGQVLEMSTITHLPAGSKPPRILRGLDYTVIIVETRDIKTQDMSASSLAGPLALGDLIGLLVAKDEDND